MAKTVESILLDGSLSQHLRTIALMNEYIAALDDARHVELRVRPSVNGEVVEIYLPLPKCDSVVNAVRYFCDERASDARKAIADMTKELLPTQPERTDE